VAPPIPSKFTQEVKQKLLAAARSGNKRAVAAKLSGISPDALYKWLRLGKRGNETYAQFAADYLKAEAEDEDAVLGILKSTLVDEAGMANPGVAMYLLNTRYGWSKANSQLIERIIDYLISKLSEEHGDLLEEILADFEEGALD
jgi:hypothetical protein